MVTKQNPEPGIVVSVFLILWFIIRQTTLCFYLSLCFDFYLVNLTGIWFRTIEFLVIIIILCGFCRSQISFSQIDLGDLIFGISDTKFE